MDRHGSGASFQLFFSVALTILVVMLPFAMGCSSESPAPGTSAELVRFPLDDLEGVIAQGGAELDPMVSADGNGSLRLTAAQPTTFRLFETGDLDVENALLLYRASVRTEGVEGTAYLEMWVQVAGMGESFSRDLQTPLSGSNDWSTEETPFFLQAGENPDNIKLNLVVDGRGTVWIDDIRLTRGPLP
jgi:hypothetical protein